MSANRQPATQGSLLDLRCYHVTGTTLKKVVQVAAAAAAGGAGVIQVRSKPIGVRDLTALAIDVAAAVGETNPATRVLIDDRVDVAAALMGEHHIHGVHIGQDDLDPRLARRILGEDAIIGLTTGTLKLVREANEYADVIDYIGAGPFRPTPTKSSGRTPLGLEGYPPLVATSAVPVVAIGDVQATDAESLAETGVAGVAIVRAFIDSEDPAALATTIVDAFDRANPNASTGSHE
ncbi:thiamine phosphate synthase [Corynebacterium macginleyi]|uniref:Thiamine-phosphate synthase n=1 Tax=Corynebacterium macginleyi TaxID=38290 RepID=A0A3M0G5M6_9CORY|nr:thiamine phosphate synthase [Corynebacterium macginleyi]MBK4139459.1 thiamine phosphate synthase [Corynebacterium macginleyi]MBK4144438.1 thiamine phosphate synthase [Corynebacterium macginleyi]MBK4148742.1 thiamine phosphate synthase [Corynebacterium macginleyi]MBK4150747.1 thiamine phosphate synthase [Corynebacterium macginleyi]MBK4152245.1 thiamine phosphate synthase [Corynebacterium macginleyi]